MQPSIPDEKEYRKRALFYCSHAGNGHGKEISAVCRLLKTFLGVEIGIVNGQVLGPEPLSSAHAKVFSLPAFNGNAGEETALFSERGSLLRKIIGVYKPQIAFVDLSLTLSTPAAREVEDLIRKLAGLKRCKVYAMARNVRPEDLNQAYLSLLNGIFILEDENPETKRQYPRNTVFLGRQSQSEAGQGEGAVIRISRFLKRAMEVKRAKVLLRTCCHLNCPMCTWQDKYDQLSEDETYALIDDLCKLGIEVMIFTGGEPMTLPYLGNVVKYAKERGIMVGLSTNGHNTVVLQRIIEHIDEVSISVYSHREDINDRISNKEGAYKAVLKSVTYLNENGIKPSIVVPVRTDNYDGIHELIAQFDGRIASISFEMVDTLESTIKEIIFSEEQLKDFYFREAFKILKASVSRNIPVRITPFFEEFENLPSAYILRMLLNDEKKYRGGVGRIFKLSGKSCRLAKELIRVTADGNIWPCCYFEDVLPSFGNLNSKSVCSIITDDRLFELSSHAKLGVGICSVCQPGYTQYDKLALQEGAASGNGKTP